MRGLQERIDEPMARLRLMHNSGLDTELGAAIVSVPLAPACLLLPAFRPGNERAQSAAPAP